MAARARKSTPKADAQVEHRVPHIEEGQRERRVFNLTSCELRAAPDGGSEWSQLVGHAAVFNSLSEDLGGFRELIDPAAFDDALTDDVRCLLNHDANYLLGRTTSGTLRLAVDGDGLAIENDLPDTSYARDIAVLMERRDLTQMSFGFRTIEDDWEVRDDGQLIRTLRKVELFDVSPVVFPAYPETSVEARSRAAAILKESRSEPETSTDPDEERAGKVLSQQNHDALVAATDALSAAGEAIAAVLASAAPVEDNADEPAEETRETPPEPQERTWDAARETLASLEVSNWEEIDAPAYCLGALRKLASAFVAGETDERKAALMRAVSIQLDNLSVNAGSCEASDELRELVAGIEQREWDDIDDWSVYVLTQMIGYGSSFIANMYASDALIELMRAIMVQLSSMLGVVVNMTGDEPDEAADELLSSPVEAEKRRLRLLELSV